MAIQHVNDEYRWTPPTKNLITVKIATTMKNFVVLPVIIQAIREISNAEIVFIAIIDEYVNTSTEADCGLFALINSAKRTAALSITFAFLIVYQPHRIIVSLIQDPLIVSVGDEQCGKQNRRDQEKGGDMYYRIVLFF